MDQYNYFISDKQLLSIIVLITNFNLHKLMIHIILSLLA
jgi:hypothetical protein